jgi:hypothetical protein
MTGLEQLLVKAAQACPAAAARIKTAAEFESVRQALKGTLTLAAVTGAVTADGTGLKAALDAGVTIYDGGKNAQGAPKRIPFAAGKAKVEVLDGLTAEAADPQPSPSGTSPTAAQAAPSPWIVKSESAYTVDGKTITFGSTKLDVSLTTRGIVFTAGDGTYLDHEVECQFGGSSMSVATPSQR